MTHPLGGVEGIGVAMAPSAPRKTRGPTPTARSLAECRKRGWRAGVVERRLKGSLTTVDLFGFIDLVALDGQPGLLAIQATGDHGGHVQTRVRKIRQGIIEPPKNATLRQLAAIERAGPRIVEAARAWLAAGNRIQVWGWGRRGAAGSRKLWTLRVVDVLDVEPSGLALTNDNQGG